MGEVNTGVFDKPLRDLALSELVAVSFGGGLNSTAVLVKWVMDDNAPPQRITFADTGNERPQTYEHIERFSEWLVLQGMPPILVTKKGGRVETLEESCLRLRHLPSLAYGGKSCSHKFKIEPQNRDMNRWSLAKDVWKRGNKVVKLIGYGAEEQKRLAKARLEDDKYFYRFPLAEWDMDREACAGIIRRAGLPVPGKSSCFFCPASRVPEILQLKLVHPLLFQRAVAMERVARDSGKLRSVKGLGRRFSWEEFAGGAEVEEEPAAPCMSCVDE